MSHYNSESEELMTYQYRFTFANGVEKVFIVSLHADTLNLIRAEKEAYPIWTRLTYDQCVNCPLDEAKHPHCPIAINLVDLIDFFKDLISFEKVEVTVNTPVRTYLKKTSVQEGFSALLGLYMVTSGCPVMDKLKPMVRTHLPFSTVHETAYRLLSTYILAQYFLGKRGKEADFELAQFEGLLKDIQQVNRYFWKRLASVAVQDASLNALVHLDNSAQYTAFSVDDDKLAEVAMLFDAYFEGG